MIPSDFRNFFVSSDALRQQEIVSFLLSLSLQEAQVHVQNVNNMDMRLRKLMDSFNGVATKYLQNYLNCFLVLDKTKNSTSIMATVTSIAFASNSVGYEYKQQLFNMLV